MGTEAIIPATVVVGIDLLGLLSRLPASILSEVS